MKKEHGSLGTRMKTYEHGQRQFLMERSPVIIRIDGCHFHSYTRGMAKPFDEDLAEAFWKTCKYLAENIVGCQLVYHQSDEISILVTNYDKYTTQSWFKNSKSKFESVAASLATAKFNEIMRAKYPDKELATFDARATVYPLHEVVNYFIWRQQDASRNSVSMVAQALFSHNSLQGLSSPQLQEKMWKEREINWDKLPVWQKRGVCIRKVNFERNGAIRSAWEADMNIPIFTQEKEYIQKHVYTGIVEREVLSIAGNHKENI